MQISISLDGSKCGERKKFCMNCNSHFISLRPHLKGVIISKHFVQDLDDEELIKSIIEKILACSHMEFTELHKFEENIDGNSVFRAKKGNLHIVYAVSPEKIIVFLRAIKNFTEYKKFIENRKEIKSMIERSLN